MENIFLVTLWLLGLLCVFYPICVFVLFHDDIKRYLFEQPKQQKAEPEYKPPSVSKLRKPK